MRRAMRVGTKIQDIMPISAASSKPRVRLPMRSANIKSVKARCRASPRARGHRRGLRQIRYELARYGGEAEAAIGNYWNFVPVMPGGSTISLKCSSMRENAKKARACKRGAGGKARFPSRALQPRDLRTRLECSGKLGDLAASAQGWLPVIDKREGFAVAAIALWDGSDLRGKKILVWGIRASAMKFFSPA